MMKSGVVLLLALIVPTSAFAFGDECREFRGYSTLSKRIERPEPPSCTQSLYGLDRTALEMCADEMTDYRFKMESYLRCLKWEGNEAASEYNNAVAMFKAGIR
jgi:hypothetical protein